MWCNQHLGEKIKYITSKKDSWLLKYQIIWALRLGKVSLGLEGCKMSCGATPKKCRPDDIYEWMNPSHKNVLYETCMIRNIMIVHNLKPLTLRKTRNHTVHWVIVFCKESLSTITLLNSLARSKFLLKVIHTHLMAVISCNACMVAHLYDSFQTLILDWWGWGLLMGFETTVKASVNNPSRTQTPLALGHWC